eukprot:gene4897-34663_t
MFVASELSGCSARQGHVSIVSVPSMHVRRGALIHRPFSSDSRISQLSIVAQATKGFGVPKPPPKAEKPKPPRIPSKGPLCPCESGKVFPDCCMPAHDGSKPAQTLEASVRARFSAYRRGDKEYIYSTFHPKYADFHYEKPMEEAREQLEADVAEACEKYDYYDLLIQKTEMKEGNEKEEGEIAFSYKYGAKGTDPEGFDRTNEKNRFLKVDGMWLFVDYQQFQYNTGALMASVDKQSVDAGPAAASKKFIPKWDRKE